MNRESRVWRNPLKSAELDRVSRTVYLSKARVRQFVLMEEQASQGLALINVMEIFRHSEAH